MGDELKEKHIEQETDNIDVIKILDNQNKLMLMQHDELKKNRKMLYIIIIIFSILVALIVSSFMLSITITEKNRNNIKIENKATSYSTMDKDKE